MTIEGIPETMLAAQVVEFNKPYKIHEIPTPSSLSEHDMLIKIAVASFCHTDSMVTSGVFKTQLPCTGSHEGAGTVVALGSSVTDFKPGDRVLVGLAYHRCGECEECRGPEKMTHYCVKHQGTLGIQRDGAFAEYEVVDSREANHLPDNLSFQSAAPLACAGATVWGGLVKGGVKKGDTIAIIGSGGGLGHLAIQFAKAQGIKVIGIDARDEGLELSKASGADLTVDARQPKEKVVEEVQGATDGKGADVTINVTDAGSAAALAAAVTKMHGALIQIAQPDNVTFPFQELIFRDIRIQGSLVSSREEQGKMLKVMAENGFAVKTNAFHGLKKLPELIELVHSGKMSGKGVIVIDDEAIQREKDSGLKML